MSARRQPASQAGALALPRALWRSALFVLGGLCITCVVAASAPAKDLPAVMPPARNRYDTHIAEAAKRFRLPPTWIRAVLGAESAGDQRATSRKGAMGLMQIVPNTWSDLRVRYRLGADPYDPHDNIIAGSAYIRELVDRYGWPGWIAAYNAGPRRYEASLKGRRLPRETLAYVAIVASAIGNTGTMKANSPTFSGRYGWKYAPLFVAQPSDTPGDPSTRPERSRDDASKTVPKEGLADAAPRSTGLFVPEASKKSAP
ncbi:MULTISPECIES: lytic transglycosylase domain-containing protein [unclassified Mesorhizobium]|uniref:lytic transglycosylase domain-containing protein n=1 Tax=unclassified Mesorhizobium TaxID=325217 RepID=UPI000FCC69ED|nr:MULTISPECIES: lytic transglycosylase domain-containing protein [unclassified Mesorhizobium]RUW36218.1 lytic transglycosylase domain-containing protein [Mesorhizobium sp. M1E.F.Ca.ET.041.01.1.1]RWD89883.1 MAG: lytic transglycosylase domain-containing protein [Mesorhizobium sp.]RWD95870.1 MAG: lytic transglycosylase domain-containing protein [Mesorhizobium sp.]TIV55844.1 MAG: lytic transglycosylase domain-containing protein [Mesorhizobium sp.]